MESNQKTARRPCPDFIRTQRPAIGEYTIDVLKFINTLIIKVQNEVHLIRLLFCKKDVGLFDRYNYPYKNFNGLDDSFNENGPN